MNLEVQTYRYERYLIGWRQWRLNDGLLVSYASPHEVTPWDTSESPQASCGWGKQHRAPAAGCKCGFHINLFDVDLRSFDDRGKAVGLVAASGTVIVDDPLKEGARAERVDILALWAPTDTKALSERYDAVSVFDDPDDFRSQCRGFLRERLVQQRSVVQVDDRAPHIVQVISSEELPICA